MRTYVFILLALTIAMTGCKKKQPSLEEMQQPMSPEELNRMAVESSNPAKISASAQIPSSTPSASVGAVIPQAEPQADGSAKLGSLPPGGPYKPSPVEIQTALKNAGYFNGTVDGKLGPQTKTAIEAFQKDSGLEADGKVGPKTWTALSKHLNAAEPQVVIPAEKTGKKK